MTVEEGIRTASLDGVRVDEGRRRFVEDVLLLGSLCGGSSGSAESGGGIADREIPTEVCAIAASLTAVTTMADRS